jgi:hypothetical protein
MPLEINQAAWDNIVRKVVNEKAVPMCQRIADGCNHDLDERGHPTHAEANEPGYIVDTDGGKPLSKHDYHATVITKTNEAMADNAEHNTLLMHMHEGGQ